MKNILLVLISFAFASVVQADDKVEKPFATLRVEVVSLRKLLLDIGDTSLPGDAKESDTQRGALVASKESLLKLQAILETDKVDLDNVKNELAVVLHRLFLVEEGLLPEGSREALRKGRELNTKLIKDVSEAAKKIAALPKPKQDQEKVLLEDAFSLQIFCRGMSSEFKKRACLDRVTSGAFYYSGAMRVCEKMQSEDNRLSCLNLVADTKFSIDVVLCQGESTDFRRLACIIKQAL